MVLFILVMLLAGFGTVSVANAVAATPFNWTGLGTDNYLYTDGNWLDEHTPYFPDIGLNDDITGLRLIFGDARRTYVEYYELYASQLEFQGNRQGYYFNGDYDTTHIGSGGIIYNPSGNVRSTISDDIQLHASQIWNIQAGTLSIDGQISDTLGYEGESPIHGSYQIEKTGEGNLELDGNYSYDEWGGGLKLSAGTVTARGTSRYDYGYRGDEYYSYYWGDLSSALGSGPLIFNGGTLHTDQSYDGESGDTDFLRRARPAGRRA